jgi:hypothetical protein
MAVALMLEPVLNCHRVLPVFSSSAMPPVFTPHASSRCGGEGDGSLYGRRASLPRGAGHWIIGPVRLPS